MKNNVKVGQFPCSITSEADGSERIHYDSYDFAGLKGIRRRNWKTLFLIRKRYPISKVFKYSDEWDTLTDGGSISYWDQTSLAQIPKYALRDAEIYRSVALKQQIANDVLYYCLQADALIERMMITKADLKFWDIALPTILVGGIVLTAVLNMYAVSQYLQAWGLIHGTTGTLSSLQNFFTHLAGIS